MIPECQFSRGDENAMALAVEKFEKHHKELVQPDFYLRIKTGGLGSVYLCPIEVADIKRGCSGYEWDTGCAWQQIEEQEGANLRIPLRTYVLDRWKASKTGLMLGFYIIWRRFEYEVDFDEPPRLEAGSIVELAYHLSSDET